MIKNERNNNLERISMKVIHRIITILAENGSYNKTRIAQKAYLRYDYCVRYLKWLETIGLIRKVFEDKSETWSLSEKGMKFYKSFVN